ncbi:hypothetical protein GALMADRAFT_256609 [Galerina marginata CBS 339.88]|uniref:C2H2-type domain-containing protein n=1 Tax=Galerina marginata (strain CBS 339.88) TaxID=685588 RepID=A0A067SCZ6_GALM3|nr:hypothetical protein GALMADRAFT_256609 [Galerina marginata CBS 339.88]
MQAQQYALPLPPDYYAAIQAFPPPLSDHYLAQDDAQNFATSFSRGSSFTYPYQEYRYLLDRGELTSRLCTSGLVGSTLDATGLGFAGNHASNTGALAAPEDITAYQQQTWDWTGAPNGEIIAPAPVYAAQAEPDYFGIKSPGIHASGVRSPTAQLPTPAAMAVLLNPSGRSEDELSQIGYELPHTSALVANHASATARPNRIVEPLVSTQEIVPESLSREKKHACTMCHKRFDRPSTLRKHLLVHTGEKAFVCDTCGRRFGVASNLNRHVKRCILKPVNTPSPSNNSASGSGSPSAVADSPNISTLISPSLSPMSARESSASTSGSRSGKRPRAPPSPPPVPLESEVASAAPKAKSQGQKRRRRAPSPSQWIPATLQNFNLLSDDSYRVTSVPLPPVRRNPPKEERDSWDENVAHAPYHPCGWSGVLPGPGLGLGLGLGGKDVRNLNLGGRGGFMLGRVLVF